MSLSPSNRPLTRPNNFLSELIQKHLREGRYQQVVTRFPPEPNGHLHIGHAKSICLNFGLAEQFNGLCHLRMDDTNPLKEKEDYVNAIRRDVEWLGFKWKGQNEEEPYYASDYFQKLYDWAEILIQKGLAYVDSQSKEEIRIHRGSLTEPGKNSPYRTRTVEENLALFRQMKAGECEEGSHILRAKIDMAAKNILMRDPAMYRILNVAHHRQGEAWHIYPMYDYAHGLSDAIEGITHSICTLEFENNRELYDWFVEAVGFKEPRPHQYEFARLMLDYTVVSKRKLLALIEGGFVKGWDDPRMPTIAGFRRRGVRPQAIRAFADMIGVAKTNSVVDIGKLEFCIREDLDPISPRYMGVLEPLEVVVENWPEDKVLEIEAPLWPPDRESEESRSIPFSRTLYIDRSDFMEVPSKKFYRLAPGRQVRLRYGGVIACTRLEKDSQGKLKRLYVNLQDGSYPGKTDTLKVKSTIHWVSKQHALDAEVRVYDRLFTVPQPEREDGDFLDYINPHSLLIKEAKVEPAIVNAKGHLQLERQGYFFWDEESQDQKLVLNRVIALKDAWKKLKEQDQGQVAKAPKEDKPSENQQELSKEELRQLRFQGDPLLQERYSALIDRYGIHEELAEIFAGQDEARVFFEAAVKVYNNPASVGKWVGNELLRYAKMSTLQELPVTAEALAKLASLVDEGMISATAGKQVLEKLVQGGGDPEQIIEDEGLSQISDAKLLLPLIQEAIETNPKQVAAYKEGKTRLLGFFVGQVMKATEGRAHPEKLSDLLKESLGES